MLEKDNRVSQSVGVNKRKTTADNPLVSIITPVFNGIKYLEASIQNVLCQSYPYIEHVFVDGGSTDGTLEMLSSYKAKYPDRIRFISEPDKNACDAWNKGWKMARGNILGWLGSDDVYEPDAILTVVKFFRSNPDAYFVFGDYKFINERNEIIEKPPHKDFNLEEAIEYSCCISTPSAFYKREVIEKVGFLDTSINACDLDYWIRVGKVFHIYRIEKVLSTFRLHKDSISGSKGAKIYPREFFIISRRHGGHIFSLYGIKYFGQVMVEWLRPVLGHIYPFIYPFIKRVAYPFVKRVVRKIFKL